MWYFTWILGVLLACAFAIVNALWLEVSEDMDRREAELTLRDIDTAERGQKR